MYPVKKRNAEMLMNSAHFEKIYGGMLELGIAVQKLETVELHAMSGLLAQGSRII